MQAMRRRVMAWLGGVLTMGAARTLASAAPGPPVASTSQGLVAHALRLRPGEDLRAALYGYAKQHGLQAAAVASCAGSLTRATIRFANQPVGSSIAGPLEIVSLSGTLEATGGHLHIAVSDGTGRTVGGHLMEGSAIYTTAEVVLVELPALVFRRERDPQTTFDELAIDRREKAAGSAAR